MSYPFNSNQGIIEPYKTILHSAMIPRLSSKISVSRSGDISRSCCLDSEVKTMAIIMMMMTMVVIMVFMRMMVKMIMMMAMMVIVVVVLVIMVIMMILMMIRLRTMAVVIMDLIVIS